MAVQRQVARHDESRHTISSEDLPAETTSQPVDDCRHRSVALPTGCSGDHSTAMALFSAYGVDRMTACKLKLTPYFQRSSPGAAGVDRVGVEAYGEETRRRVPPFEGTFALEEQLSGPITGGSESGRIEGEV